MENNTELKNRIKQWAMDAGADMIGFAPVERWDDDNRVPQDFRPRSIWDPARTVIVMGVCTPLPVIDTTPSILHKETYDTANRVLDTLGYNLVRFLIRQGQPADYFCRDGFASLRLLKDRPKAAFGHAMAAWYAGLGTIGVNNCVLTPLFGPRVRFVSVFTAAVLPPDPMIEKDLCIKCETCVKCCPVDALKMREDQFVGEYDLPACLQRHIELTADKSYPCGICCKVCPIGKDRAIFKQKGILKKYLQEEEALKANSEDPAYKNWTQVRKYGTWNKDYPR